MPELQRDAAPEGPRVTGFRGCALLIDGTPYDGAVILTPEGVRPWDGADLLAAADLEPAPEFVLLGTGAVLEQPRRATVAALEARGVGIEAMDTRAAARAWGVLRSEGRWVSAALRPL